MAKKKQEIEELLGKAIEIKSSQEPKMPKTREAKTEVNISPIKIATMTLKIKGETPLLMERFSDSARETLKNIVEGKGREKRKNRNLEQEAKEKIHLTEDNKPGFPAQAFKKAMVEAAPYLDGMDKKRARGSFFIIGDIVPIKFKKQVLNKALGRDSGINHAPREIWRPEFRDWECELLIRFNEAQITPHQIIELSKLSGFHIGIGGWRPQCDGQYGMYSVDIKN